MKKMILFSLFFLTSSVLASPMCEYQIHDNLVICGICNLDQVQIDTLDREQSVDSIKGLLVGYSKAQGFENVSTYYDPLTNRIEVKSGQLVFDDTEDEKRPTNEKTDDIEIIINGRLFKF